MSSNSSSKKSSSSSQWQARRQQGHFLAFLQALTKSLEKTKFSGERLMAWSYAINDYCELGFDYETDHGYDQIESFVTQALGRASIPEKGWLEYIESSDKYRVTDKLTEHSFVRETKVADYLLLRNKKYRKHLDSQKPKPIDPEAKKLSDLEALRSVQHQRRNKNDQTDQTENVIDQTDQTENVIEISSVSELDQLQMKIDNMSAMLENEKQIQSSLRAELRSLKNNPSISVDILSEALTHIWVIIDSRDSFKENDPIYTWLGAMSSELTKSSRGYE